MGMGYFTLKFAKVVIAVLLEGSVGEVLVEGLSRGGVHYSTTRVEPRSLLAGDSLAEALKILSRWGRFHRRHYI